MADWTYYGHNYTLDDDRGFYISYLPKDNSKYKEIGMGVNEGYVGETALVKEEPWKCLILNGDFRKEYEELFPKGYEACLEFYNNNKDKRSSWSEDE